MTPVLYRSPPEEWRVTQANPSASTDASSVRDKRVVITGAGRGLGRWLATAFSKQGAKIALVARTESDLIALSDELPGEALVCTADVTNLDDNERVADSVIEAWGGLDVWISNAGISPVVTGPLDIDPTTWREIIDVNLTGSFFGARAAARVMRDGGRIVFTGSVLGERPRKGLGAYSASKAGLVGLAKSLAVDLAPRGINVNVVAPGWFDSPLAEGWTSNPKLSARIVEHTVQGRWGIESDLPGAYLFLASDSSKFITGTVIDVDGGYLLA
jgi:NAD(P)-dependent dehydrogenase (short-subunit alcohol dehydrogenase family)